MMARDHSDLYLSKFDRMAVYYGWDEQDKAYNLFYAMEGNAAAVMRQCRSSDTYADMCTALKQNLGTDKQQVLYRQTLRCRRQNPNESLQDMALDIQTLANLAYPTSTVEDRDTFFELPTFLEAIADRELRKLVRTQAPTSLWSAVVIPQWTGV